MNPSTPKNKSKGKRVSVIIPGYGRKETLRSCLMSLCCQTLLPDEVIVTDNSGGSAVREVIAGMKKNAPFRLRYVPVAKSGAGNARAAGIHVSRSPLLAFIDDDCIPENTWIAELVRKLDARTGAVVQGRSENGLPDNLFASLNHFKDQQFLQNGVYSMLSKSFTPWFDAKNSLIPRALFRKGILAFRDVELEDLDLSVQMANRRIPVIYAPQALVFHFGRTGWSASLRRWIRMGVGRYILRTKLRSSGTHFYRSPAIETKIRIREERIRRKLLRSAVGGKSLAYRILFHVLYRTSIAVTNGSYLFIRILKP